MVGSWRLAPPRLPFNFGESPWLIDFETGLPNTGNFGVIYRWHVALSNPTDRPRKFALYFTPKNGAAALSMPVNNEVVSVPFTPRNDQVGSSRSPPAAN